MRRRIAWMVAILLTTAALGAISSTPAVGDGSCTRTTTVNVGTPGQVTGSNKYACSEAHDIFVAVDLYRGSQLVIGSSKSCPNALQCQKTVTAFCQHGTSWTTFGSGTASPGGHSSSGLSATKQCQ